MSISAPDMRKIPVDPESGSTINPMPLDGTGQDDRPRVDAGGGLIISESTFRQFLIELRLSNRIAFTASNLNEDFDSLRRDAETEIDAILSNS